MVDIIQAVGRVMRKAPDKKLGYIILPIALSEDELKHLDNTLSNDNFKHIWSVLKALRSHDSSLVNESVFKEKIKLALYAPRRGSGERSDDGTREAGDTYTQMTFGFGFDTITLKDIADSLYSVIPTKLGDRGYWESFSAKTAKITQTISQRLSDIFAKHPSILEDFLISLKHNIHPHITNDEAIDMICSHLITKRIFKALFGDDMSGNPIGKALDEITTKLESQGLNDAETRSLNALYESVESEAKVAKDPKAKQTLIKNLYDTFFRTAFAKQAQRLGIVYTPIEVVDFILHSTSHLLNKHFSLSFNDPQVKVFDPFTGTGSFLTRLIDADNALISAPHLHDKLQNGIFAQDIILLAYYIALINITQSAQMRDASLPRFSNIALGDSLSYFEEESDEHGLFAPIYKDLEDNKHTQNTIKNQNIRVIIGNPPYSSGAKSENDNNANLPHPKLEARVKETYGKESDAKMGKTTRDTLIQAIRMATDLLQDEGIIGFVVNGGFIDATSADGFRKCAAKDFSDIYIVNLRGNARTSGEQRQKEGGGIFDNGSRASVAIVFFIKDTKATENHIHYYEVEDYLSREDKLALLRDRHSLASIPLRPITPNAKGDWINQRSADYDSLLPLKREVKQLEGYIFHTNCCGVASNRDSWVYNFSKDTLKDSLETCIDTYNSDLEKFDAKSFKAKHDGIKTQDLYNQLTDKDITTDPTKIAWTCSLKNKLIKNRGIENYSQDLIRESIYRPFVKTHLYFDKVWNERQSQLPQLLATKESENIFILTSLMATKPFSSFICDSLMDLQTLGNTQAYPLYYYPNGQKEYAISHYALKLFQSTLNDPTIDEEGIFYYIYALFHHRAYTEKYRFELAKESPRIPISKDFHALSRLGRQLAHLHLHYESLTPYDKIEYRDGLLSATDQDSFYQVEQIRREKDGTRIIYNANITITDIPKEAYTYQINQKSAIDWVIQSYAIKTHKESLIKNDPNLYKGSKYIFTLLCQVITLSLESIKLIDAISKLESN